MKNTVSLRYNEQGEGRERGRGEERRGKGKDEVEGRSLLVVLDVAGSVRRFEDLPIVEEGEEANDQLVVGGDDGVLVDNLTEKVELVYIRESKQYSFW